MIIKHFYIKEKLLITDEGDNMKDFWNIKKASKEELQNLFKHVKNHADFTYFQDVLKFNESYLCTKKRGLRCFSFTKDFNPDKARYLIDDRVSVGHCRWENLHKYLDICKW